MSLGILWLHPDRLTNIIHDGTLHGILGERFGERAAQLAAVASTVGFAGLIGWEAVVGATLLQNFGGVSAGLYVVLPVLIALVAAYYTRNGGLEGNGELNQAQNLFKAVILVVATGLLIANAPDHIGSDNANKSLSEAWVALGGIGLAANLAFSLLWQTVDMSVWQSLAGLSRGSGIEAAREIRSAIVRSAISVLIFPGIIGTLIGVTIAGLNVTPNDTNVLNMFVASIGDHFFVALLLIASFAAAMLSTIDGYSLAASQAISWDLVRAKEARHLIALGVDRDPTPQDKRVISLSRAIIFFVGVGGSVGMISLVFGMGVGLFSLVYIVVVGQMSLSGPVLFTLFGRENFRLAMGWLPIAASLLCGLITLGAGVWGSPDLLTWAPVVTISISVGLTLLLYLVRSRDTDDVAAAESTL
jgi:hypothetical protein